MAGASGAPGDRDMTATRATLLLFLGSKVCVGLLWPWSQAAAIACFFGFDFWLGWQIIAPSSQGLGRTFTRFRTEKREVWLTIDDGPDPQDTPQILKLLAHHRATATFFVIGERAARHPQLISAIRAAGHEIAHHTHTHPIKSLWAAGPRRMARELDDALATLATQRIQPTRFRTPGGTKCLFQESALARRKLTHVTWSVRSWDTMARKPEAVTKRIMRQVSPGAIILVHEGATVPAAIRVKLIAHLLVTLDQAGYRCVIPAENQLC